MTLKRTTPLKRTPFKKTARVREVKARPMRQGKSTTAPTKDEKEWMAWIKQFGCVACHLAGWPTDPERTAVHHLLSGGRRMGHLFTIGLCDPGHHQNGPPGVTSRHPDKARFESLYGSEAYLLEYLQLKRKQTS